MRPGGLWKERLEACEDPGLAPEIDAELREYMAKTKETLPDRDYF